MCESCGCGEEKPIDKRKKEEEEEKEKEKQ